jgi:hypothetical protein
MAKKGKGLIALIFLIALLNLVDSSLRIVATPQVSIQAGARGDDASAGAIGIRADILTHVYEADPMVLDYFWVGVVLAGGAFAQFGYALQPGNYCLKGELANRVFVCSGQSALIFDSDVRWEWQYWPDQFANDFYYEIGPTGSAGVNDTWHQYSILLSHQHSLSFSLDGKQVGSIQTSSEQTGDSPMIIAEKTEPQGNSGRLGPVEFANLSYLKQSSWRQVDSLVSVSGCGFNATCSFNIPYGVLVEGANHIIAGSTVPLSQSGALLWTSGYVTLNITAGSNVVFEVNSLTGDQAQTSFASIREPKGLLVTITLSAPERGAGGLLGAIGAVEDFRGWTGDVNTSNRTVKVVTDRNETLTATWSLSVISLLPAVVTVTLIGLGSLMLFRRRRTPHRSAAAND